MKWNKVLIIPDGMSRQGIGEMAAAVVKVATYITLRPFLRVSKKS